MGFKSSMVTVSNPAVVVSERDLLDRLGFADFALEGETTLEESMYPDDKSMNIGYYNNCIIICDDYELSDKAATGIETGADYELTLSALFPGSEILTTACHSGVNYHLYAMVKDGKRVRFKEISSETSLREFGKHLPEEDEVYKRSKVVDGKRLFTSDYTKEEVYEYEEDQMMEAFTFGVAKRHLGVLLDHNEGDELTFETPFKKYKKATTTRQQTTIVPASPAAPAIAPASSSWLTRLRKKLGI